MPSILTELLTSPHHPDIFALDRSRSIDQDTVPTNDQSDDLLPVDDSVNSDYFSDFFDVDRVANIETANAYSNDVLGDEDDDEDILSRHPPARRQPVSSGQLAQPASQPVPRASRPQLSFSSQRNQPRGDKHVLDRRRNIGTSAAALPHLTPQSFNHADSAIHIEDDDDDDLHLLGQGDFSSPSILNDTPLQGTPLRVSERINLSPDDDTMPQTRSRAASQAVAAAAPFPLPLPGDPIVPSTATPTPSWSRTRAGFNALPSPTAVTTTSSAPRSSAKRRRSNDPGVGSSSTGLPPMAMILASVGTSSGSANGDSQASSSSSSTGNNTTGQSTRSRISPKRPRVNEPIILDDDLFGSDDDDNGGVEMVNLVDIDRPQTVGVKDEIVEATEGQETEGAAGRLGEAQPEKKNLIKLSGLQCVICMDDMTDMTVTHCGHLFCGECLFSSLHSTEQRICPICRSKIEMRAPHMSTAKMARTYYPLQLKLRPRKPA
ncbi:uncharacterized protein SPSK_05224 [Sporothrix schenckii 1099-18]|uniref:RING-type domain-containing protein n=1 Tax=Sporothrix schenckii 1099-18 TaxID=1397361 RepID=A0A0F2LWE7_SPOSC|nr:uncharacterized protein SPSK_05224 [Sporothrix schenckii 1099-18]KJR80820.1 hypothetical protein SPSK_05224 [Sporothrix schenckii 1099-18]